MKKSNLYKSTSFMELKSIVEEKDDIDDDDEEVPANKPTKSNLKRSLRSNLINSKIGNTANSDEELNFTEVQSIKKDGKKKKTIVDFVYSKPKDNLDDADINRIRIFRNTQMTDLQKSHTWEPALTESINEEFNKNAAALGKKNTDEFVTFLGFLRDASYRASRMIAKNDEKKLLEHSK
jgi:hypothetical protein